MHIIHSCNVHQNKNPSNTCQANFQSLPFVLWQNSNLEAFIDSCQQQRREQVPRPHEGCLYIWYLQLHYLPCAHVCVVMATPTQQHWHVHPTSAHTSPLQRTPQIQQHTLTLSHTSPQHQYTTCEGEGAQAKS